MGINFKNERGEIGIENKVLGFEIEVADCLFDEGEKKKSENKGGTQMVVAMFVIPCNYVSLLAWKANNVVEVVRVTDTSAPLPPN